MAPVSQHQEQASLLLLPALPLPSPPSSLKSAYKATFETLLPKLVQPRSETISRLDVAIGLAPSYPVPSNVSRSAIFPTIQRLLDETYSLICSVAAHAKVELDFPGGLDVRIFMLDARLDKVPESLVGNQCLFGPIVDVQTFVLSSRSYTALYSVEGETGEAYLKSLVTAWQAQNKTAPPIHRLPSGPSISHPETSQESVIEEGPVTTHKSVAVGGTFDHLHIGHKLLLTATILAADPSQSTQGGPRLITVGITGDALLVNKKYGAVVEPWATRQERSAAFIESILAFHPDLPSITTTEYFDEPGPNGKIVRVTYALPGREDSVTINYTQISDPFGPTITDERISALVISAETRAGGKAVNDKRTEKGWKELEVFEVDVLDAGVGEEGEEKKEKQGFESKISSTEIRRRLQERGPAS